MKDILIFLAFGFGIVYTIGLILQQKAKSKYARMAPPTPDFLQNFTQSMQILSDQYLQMSEAALKEFGNLMATRYIPAFIDPKIPIEQKQILQNQMLSELDKINVQFRTNLDKTAGGIRKTGHILNNISTPQEGVSKDEQLTHSV